ISESWRKGCDAGLAPVSRAEFVFEREECLAVGIAGGEVRVIEREDERIDIRHPAEARRLNSWAHRDAVGEHGFDAHLVEHPGRVGIALLFAGYRLVEEMLRGLAD